MDVKVHSNNYTGNGGSNYSHKNPENKAKESETTTGNKDNILQEKKQQEFIEENKIINYHENINEDEEYKYQNHFVKSSKSKNVETSYKIIEIEDKLKNTNNRENKKSIEELETDEKVKTEASKIRNIKNGSDYSKEEMDQDIERETEGKEISRTSRKPVDVICCEGKKYNICNNAECDKSCVASITDSLCTDSESCISTSKEDNVEVKDPTTSRKEVSREIFIPVKFKLNMLPKSEENAENNDKENTKRLQKDEKNIYEGEIIKVNSAGIHVSNVSNVQEIEDLKGNEENEQDKFNDKSTNNKINVKWKITGNDENTKKSVTKMEQAYTCEKTNYIINTKKQSNNSEVEELPQNIEEQSKRIVKDHSDKENQCLRQNFGNFSNYITHNRVYYKNTEGVRKLYPLRNKVFGSVVLFIKRGIG